MGYLSVACEYFDRPPIVFVLSWVLEVLRNLKVLTPLPKIPVTLQGPQVSWLPRAWRQHFPSKLQCGTRAPTGSCTHHTVKARWRSSLLHPVSQPLLWHPLKSIDCFFHLQQGRHRPSVSAYSAALRLAVGGSSIYIRKVGLTAAHFISSWSKASKNNVPSNSHTFESSVLVFHFILDTNACLCCQSTKCEKTWNLHN